MCLVAIVTVVATAWSMVMIVMVAAVSAPMIVIAAVIAGARFNDHRRGIVSPVMTPRKHEQAQDTEKRESEASHTTSKNAACILSYRYEESNALNSFSFSSNRDLLSASTLSRKRFSVLDGRILNHQPLNSIETPSRSVDVVAEAS